MQATIDAGAIPNVDTKKSLTRKDLLKSWFIWNSFSNSCYNYERLMGLAFCHSMVPILKRLYKNDKEKLAEGLTRHMGFFNTENSFGSMIGGIVASLEEEKANGAEIEPDAITNIKTALMGPLAGIGDAVTQSMIKVVLLGICIDMAIKGLALGPILFVLLFSAYAVGVSYFAYFSGYRLGKNAVTNLLSNNLVKVISEGFGAVGMMVLGGLVVSRIPITTPLAIVWANTKPTPMQPILDSILPGLLPLTLFLGVFFLLKKGLSPTKMMIVLAAVAAVLSLLNVLV